ncbi:MAG: hypothetical protein C4524_02490 [Candidatus Zixiibacteriota bacterium]|nr:MAG: hypothetical protein C4524_02490 [candidate division Zixibacteria bacterium]
MYIPTHRAGKPVEQNAIRFKNQLKVVEKALRERGFRDAQVKDFMAPAEGLISDGFFWLHQSDGLAVFMNPEGFHFHRLPYAFQEQTVVSRRFFVKPLLPLLGTEQNYYLLALNRNNLRIFQGSRYGLREIEVDGVPKTLDEALQYDQMDKALQYHTQTPPVTSQGAGRRAALFHGHGAGGDDTGQKKDLLQYFHMVDRGMHEVLRDSKVPLILAGVDYLKPIYEEANTYSNLLRDGVVGTTDKMAEEALHQKSWEVMQRHLEQRKQEALEQYDLLKGTERAGDRLEEVVKGAFSNRVLHLFVNPEARQWGTFDPGTFEVVTHDEPHPEDEDLLDYAAVQTIQHRGFVHTIKPDELPDGRPLAAVFRY